MFGQKQYNFTKSQDFIQRHLIPKPHFSGFHLATDVQFANFFFFFFFTEKYNFLGISIVGQSNEKGDGGIYIGSIMKGYAKQIMK